MSVPQCPRCERPLSTIAFRQWSAEICPHCEGVLVQGSTLVELLSQPDLQLSALRPALQGNHSSPHSHEKLEEAVLCPECQTRMTKGSFSEEVPEPRIHRCQETGTVWFDDGDFGKLVEMYQNSTGSEVPSLWESFRRLMGLKPYLRSSGPAGNPRPESS